MYHYKALVGIDKYGKPTIDYDQAVEFDDYNGQHFGTLCYGIYDGDDKIADVFEEDQAANLTSRLND